MAGAHRRDRLRASGYYPPDPADRRDQLGDGVLGRDRISQDGGIHRPLTAATEHPGRGDDRPHRVVDPLRPLRLRQPFTPIHQRGRIKTLVIQRHPGGDLPPQITPGCLRGLPVRQIMQRLQHQNRGHHRRRDRRPTLPRREQVLKLVVTEQILAMISQKREHAARCHQMPHQGLSIQQIPIRPLHTLHEPNFPSSPKSTRADTPIIQRPPRCPASGR